MLMKASRAMVACLEHEQISHIFGIPGAAIAPFYDALYESKIDHILVLQEQSAGHAASGYARATGRPAVCVTTSGPGALNLLTAVATAYIDSIPLIAITGQVSSEQLGRDVFQEADITGAVEPFVKHSFLVKNASDIPRVFKEAFYIASTGRQGAVLIDVPFDVQNCEIDFSYPESVDIVSYKPNINGHMGQIKRVITALKASNKPLICVGGGVISAKAGGELVALCEANNIPLVTTMMGIGAVSPLHPLNLGMIGMYGNSTANNAMNAADIIVLIGARVGDRAIMSPIGLSHNTVIVHIDIDPAEIGKNIPTNIPLVGDAKVILSEIVSRLSGAFEAPWVGRKALTATGRSKTELAPRDIIAALMARLSKTACVVADVGQNLIWTARGYTVPNGKFLSSGGMGTMGYALPCGIGAAIADKARQVVVICGDGGFQMSMMELGTIAAHHIGVKIIILNNSCLGMVKELQDKLYGRREIGISLAHNPNFVAIAAAYGIRAKKIASPNEIDDTIEEMLSDNEPFLLECAISSDEKTLQEGE